MEIVNVEEVFTLLQLEPAIDRQPLVALLIPEVLADYKRIQNKNFDTDGEGNEIYPQGSKLTVALMIGYILDKQYGISSHSISKYTQTNEITVQGYPKGITDRIAKYVKYV